MKVIGDICLSDPNNKVRIVLKDSSAIKKKMKHLRIGENIFCYVKSYGDNTLCCSDESWMRWYEVSHNDIETIELYDY